jgi:hypothetical protein
VHSTRRALTAAALLAGSLLAACGDDPAATTADSTGPEVTLPLNPTPATGEGTINVALEQTDGVFIEGFEIGLRFTTADGTVVKALLWNDFVASLDSTDINAYYDSVLEQPVPAGTITVEADVRISPGGAIVPPDLEAEELPCSLDVEVPESGSVDVEVSFSGESGCISLVG